jgi:D-alanyl-D-alanine carboxypeptidase
MKLLLRYGCWIVLLAGILLSCKKTPDAPTPDDSIPKSKVQYVADTVRTSLEQTLNTTVPSLNVLIETPMGRYFVSSQGEAGPAVTEYTNFRIASNTKTFTAVAILYMQQLGWLNIDDHITDIIPESFNPYVPQYPEWNFPYKQDVTIKLLLQHGAGIYDVSNDSVPGFNGPYVESTMQLAPGHQFSATELVNILTWKNLSYWAPGTAYHYSNTGYTILGEIISRVYSAHEHNVYKTYGDFMQDKVTGATARVPLGIRFPELATDQQLAAPYVTGKILEPGGIVTTTDQVNASAHVAEGNGCGNMADMNRFIRTTMKGSNLLTPASVQLMQHETGPATYNELNYALGCNHLSNLGYGHNGATEGYLSMMYYDPITDVSVVVMLPFWDLRQGKTSLQLCINAMTNAAWDARSALGYPGRP